MSQDPHASFASETSARLRAALQRVLRPIVKLMLSQGLPFQQAAGLLKQVYFDVASSELEQSRKRANDSRLTMITGIHRKELRRLREAAQWDDEIPKSVSRGAQLVAHWISTPQLLDAQERPLPLRRATDPLLHESGAPSFDELAMSVSTDIHPRSVLDELLRLGVVRVDDDKRIHLITTAFVPRKGFTEKLYYFGRNGHDHLEAAVRNIVGDEAPLMERSVHYDNLGPDDVNLLSRFVEQEGMKLLESVNRLARELGEKSTQQKTERMNFGLYFYRGPETRGSDGGDGDA